MTKNILKQIKISEYLTLLKDGSDIQKISEIESELSTKIQGGSAGFDLALFQLNKDLLLFQCKYILAMLEFDSEKMELYAQKIEALRVQIQKKAVKVNNADPYTSFLQWLLTLKKYYGSDIDTSNDLLYLVSATDQMMRYYKSQEDQIEKAKRK